MSRLQCIDHKYTHQRWTPLTTVADSTAHHGSITIVVQKLPILPEGTDATIDLIGKCLVDEARSRVEWGPIQSRQPFRGQKVVLVEVYLFLVMV